LSWPSMPLVELNTHCCPQSQASAYPPLSLDPKSHPQKQQRNALHITMNTYNLHSKW
jgi:hypothetical protein